MLDVMNQAKNAIIAYNEALESISNNIANTNVTGYKGVDVSFQSVFEKVLTQGTAANSDMGGTNPIQLGSGMSVAGTNLDFSQGDFVTGTSLDLAINGQGLFILSPDAGNSYLYTRAGNFEINSAGSLTSNGMQVYGLDSAGNLVAITNLPSGNKSDYQWSSNGTLQYSSDGGSTYTSTGYQIALTYFANPGGLAQAHGTSFAETLASGQAATAQAAGGAVGSLQTAQREKSNVFYLDESLDALELQRIMSSNLSMIQMASSIISSFIQSLGS